MSDIPTPITDAELCVYYPNDLHLWPEGRKAEFGGEHIVPARVCRSIERRLALLTLKIREWQSMSDAEIRLRCGELTAQDIRNIKSVLEAILPTQDNE